jgi:predicted cation transporter
MSEQWVTGGLMAIMVLVLTLPFFSHRVEKQLELFLFITGVVAVMIAGMWSRHLIHAALVDPIKITLAVLIAGLLFRLIRPKIGVGTSQLARRIGLAPLVFLLVVGLGLLSSFITAIIAALILAEVISTLRLPRRVELRLVVIACFSIGVGAVLTPLGEPLSTIAIAKLAGEPHHAGFFFLLGLLGRWVIPLILGLGLFAALLPSGHATREPTLTEDKPEQTRDIVIRAAKVYVFILALVFLGTAFTPIVDRYLTRIPALGLYWINIVSAVLDNATVTAAEITPMMSEGTIGTLLLGLLIAGGMLIPGNIPNIICANKLAIKSSEWAHIGVPLGLVLMTGIFLILTLAEFLLRANRS